LESLALYAGEIGKADVLTAGQEKFLFRKYNYLKFEAVQWQRKIRLSRPQARLVSKVWGYLRQAEEVRSLLIRSNLRLVLSVARKHAHSDAEMLELVSEGNVALLNAVEKFDFSRGFKFSTYASWAIAKRFATLRSKQVRQVEHTVGEEVLELAHNLRVGAGRVVAVESARRSLEEVMAEALEGRERLVVREHYGLVEPKKVSGQRKSKSFRQIGKLLGLSKERVRQIELSALHKLRRVLTAEQFEVLLEG